ncbi:MAG: hypothetical protein GC136_03840 [Alphaproteobacteria bacterium]|nr:hypothetical protein [Alphaproteobacteria bacterium]
MSGLNASFRARISAQRMTLLISALMTFLGLLCFFSGWQLYTWQSNVLHTSSNMVVLEILQQQNGQEISSAALNDYVTKATQILKSHPAVANAAPVSQAELAEELSPVLGAPEMVQDTIPLPRLLQVEMKAMSPDYIALVESDLKAASIPAKIIPSNPWLASLKDLSQALMFAMFILEAMCFLALMFAVGGTVQSQIAIQWDELELYHIMGAKDDFVIKQFYKTILRQIAWGCFAGAIIAIIVLGGLLYFWHQRFFSYEATITNYGLVGGALLLPLAFLAISWLTTRHMVVKNLNTLP